MAAASELAKNFRKKLPNRSLKDSKAEKENYCAMRCSIMLLTSYMTDFNKCLENIDFQLNSNALQAPKREKSIMKFIFYDLFTIFRKLLNELTLSFLLTKAFWRFGDLCQAHFQSFFDIDVTDLFVFSISEKRKSEVEQCQIIFQSSYQDCLILFCNS